MHCCFAKKKCKCHQIIPDMNSLQNNFNDWFPNFGYSRFTITATELLFSLKKEEKIIIIQFISPTLVTLQTSLETRFIFLIQAPCNSTASPGWALTPTLHL